MLEVRPRARIRCPLRWQETLAADPLKQLRARVLQVRAAVKEEHLAGDHRQQLVVVAAEPVASPGQHQADPPRSLRPRGHARTRARLGSVS